MEATKGLWRHTASRLQSRHLRATAIFGPRATERHLRPFRLPGVEFQVHADREPLDSPEAVLLFGGDGTVHHYLPALIEKKIPFLPVPVGSGNDFARAVGNVSADVALKNWRHFVSGGAAAVSVDAGEITHAGGKAYYCCVAGAGFDSATNRIANSLPAWMRSRGGYALSVVLATLRYRPVPVVAEAEGHRAAERAMMVAFANAPSYGAGMRVAPLAKLDDGRLDVCFVRRTGKLRLLRLFPLVYRGLHLDLPEVLYFQSDSLRVQAERALDVYADGEFVCQTPVEVRVAPGALRVIANRPEFL